ncbi:MAG TPA: 2-phospho-L-lactate guanylyltransferase [Ramlibacter sp.]|nr:2-phospho-L-lactate guanylyltransferase [Ramlibacter sp.]
MKPWLILPFKSIRGGKSRLAAVLAPQQRREINHHLLSRSIAVACEYAGPERVLVVSACEEALAIARGQDCRALTETSQLGLNAALEHAISHVQTSGAADILLLSCDLPQVRASDLDAVVQLGRRRESLVLATDRAGTGTNALYLPPGQRIRLHYGPGSCELHLAEANRRGLPLHVIQTERLAFDVDWPGDLQEWRPLSSARHAVPALAA